ncbi:BTAD domain-containing putative transcriptional regulator [Kitasatospora sp. NPDC101176]|uniref:AfsR/SARP family transcriptional regulator n=1 Tax=Kitasatospora sp. NPDC101176 TaxID=3364099 RepID=UPI003801CF26
MLHFSTLGSLRARRGDRELRLNRARDRAVLAVLLANAGRPVPVAEIIDGVWGEEADGAPDRARGLPATMYRLRSALAGTDGTGKGGSGKGGSPDGGSVLRHVGKAYRLEADPANIDRAVFLAELAAATAARHNRQPERAHALLTAALGRWSTPVALDGVPGPFAEHDRRMLAGRREEARLARLELDVELGLPLTEEPAPEQATVVPRALAQGRAGRTEQALALLAGADSGSEAAALAARLRDPAADLADWTPWASRTAPRAGSSAVPTPSRHRGISAGGGQVSAQVTTNFGGNNCTEQIIIWDYTTGSQALSSSFPCHSGQYSYTYTLTNPTPGHDYKAEARFYWQPGSGYDYQLSPDLWY